MLALGVDEEVVDAFLLEQPVDEVIVGLAVLNAVVPGAIVGRQPVLKLGHRVVGEDLLDDLRHRLVLENLAVRRARKIPKPRVDTRPVMSVTPLSAQTAELADQPVEVPGRRRPEAGSARSSAGRATARAGSPCLSLSNSRSKVNERLICSSARSRRSSRASSPSGLDTAAIRAACPAVTIVPLIRSKHASPTAGRPPGFWCSLLLAPRSIFRHLWVIDALGVRHSCGHRSAKPAHRASISYPSGMEKQERRREDHGYTHGPGRSFGSARVALTALISHVGFPHSLSRTAHEGALPVFRSLGGRAPVTKTLSLRRRASVCRASARCATLPSTLRSRPRPSGAG